MQFESLDAQIQTCEQHLDATNTRSTEVEFFLVQYLLIRVCAEYETRIPILIKRRCARPMPDNHVRHYAEKSTAYFSKRFAISDLGDNLARFGGEYKKVFTDLVHNTPSHSSWDNIYTNRVAVAHNTGVQMTLRDFKTDYAKSVAVLDALVSALELKPPEIADLK